MTTSINIRSVLALALAFGIMPASAEPVLFPDNGHYYEIIADPGSGYASAEAAWNAANAAANTKLFAGTFGHLATITSPGENQFIEDLRAAAVANEVLNAPAVWAGGYQELPCATGTPPNCGWTWVNEGAFTDPYPHWQAGEPNDNGGVEERFYTLGHRNIPGGNDERVPGHVGGFVVEWDTVATLSGEDCNPECTYNGIEYTVEIADDEEITFQSFLREDDDDDCGMETRDFTFQTVNGPVQTTMAKYLCGVLNPATQKREFVAVVVSKSFASAQAADVETDPSVYFPGFSLICQKPIPAGTDLRNQDIAHFATDVIGQMPRQHSSDATYGCGTSRGKVKGTVLFIGTQYVFKDGAGNELNLMGGDPESVEQAFIGITRDRLEDFILAIDNAKPAVPKKHRLRWAGMRALAGLALWSHDHGKYKVARAKINLANQILPTISFNSIPGADPAFIDIWGSHLVFMYDAKVIPYAP